MLTWRVFAETITYLIHRDCSVVYFNLHHNFAAYFCKHPSYISFLFYTYVIVQTMGSTILDNST